MVRGLSAGGRRIRTLGPPVCEIAIKLRAESRRGMSDGGVSLDPLERTMGRRWLAVAGAALVAGASAAQVVVPALLAEKKAGAAEFSNPPRLPGRQRDRAPRGGCASPG